MTSQGCTIRLRGVDVSGLEYSPTGDYGNGTAPTTTISGVGMADYPAILSEVITAWHCNIVRLPVNQDYWFGCGNLRDYDAAVNTAAYRGMIQAAVSVCSAHNAYLDLDLHWSGTYGGTAPTAPCGGGGWGTAGGSASGSTGQAPMPDWNSVAFWSSVASVIGNNPAVLYDLYNEPFAPNGNDSGFWSTWQDGGAVAASGNVTYGDAQPAFNTPGFQYLVDTIRGAGVSNVLVVGGLQYSYDLTGLSTNALADTASNSGTTVAGNGILYSAHVYNNKGVTAGGWDPYVTVATTNHAVMIEEFGESSTDPSNWDNQTIAWINGSNDKSYVYSAMAWAFSPDDGPQLLTSFSGYPATSYHGAPVSTWLSAISSTGTCPAWTSTPTPTDTPCGYPGNTCTPTLTPTATNTPTITLTPVPVGPVVAIPNRLTGGNTTTTFRVPESGATLEISLYTVAGEWMATERGVSGSSLCLWNSTGKASGLYLARVKVTDPGGSVRAQILKLVVIR